MTAPSRRGGVVLIADPDRGFRRAAARALGATGLRILEATTGEDALAGAEDAGVGVVIVEVHLPGISGYEVCRRLRERRGDALSILFVSHDRTESSDRVAGLLLGADDYLAKPIAPDELLARVRLHLRRAQVSELRSRSTLTGRERDVLSLLATGLGPAEIGRELSISPRTVGTHVEHIYSKLGVHTRAQAVASAFRLDLVEA